VDFPRLDYWVGVGAQVSDRVRDVVKEHKKAAAAAADAS
jgi:ribosomal protein S16